VVTLRPMQQPEFDEFMARLREDYPAERERNLGTSLEREEEEANRQIDGMLSQGRETVGHLFWTVTTEQHEAIGHLWVFLPGDREHAFIYSITINEGWRGKGYGRQTLAALESWLRQQGVQRIGLNVFGDNVIAQHLYATSGYRVTNATMQKTL